MVDNRMDNQDPTSPDAWKFFENQREYDNVRESVLPTDGNYSSDGEFTRIAAQEAAALEGQSLKVIKTESEGIHQHGTASWSTGEFNCNEIKQRCPLHFFMSRLRPHLLSGKGYLLASVFHI